VEIRLESTGRLFLGEDVDPKWIETNIKSIFRQELTFLDEVIESEEETKCRFAFLQKASIYKLILQCGTNETEFNETVKLGFEAMKNI
jgi:predicted nucleotide-binding protein (sugar kinase/HSP70/actin superfamily)